MCFLFGKRKILAEQKKIEEKIDSLVKEMTNMRDSINGTVNNVVQVSNNALIGGVKATLDAMTANVATVLTGNEKRIEEMRSSVDKNLREIRQDNEKRLTEMRLVVEEKLTTTISERLTVTVTSINERLDAVNKGLGEMQSLTNGVTDLKKMLGNVKNRGVFGETSLSNLLTEILTSEQYKSQFNISDRDADTRRIVDFAVVLPGNKDDKVYLPIDAKFPLEDYQRLVEASEKGSVENVGECVRALTNAIKVQAKSIKDNYILPPKTVDFALMYLPIEGLYAEVVRNPGLIEELRVKFKVIPVGPTTITALLNSLQLGFKTLAVQKSSKEIYDHLIKFKSEFEKFVIQIEKAQSQVGTVSKTLEDATKRTSIIMRKLEKVESITPPQISENLE